MATSEFRHRVSFAATSSPELNGEAAANSTRRERSTVKLWMVLDGVTVFGAAVLATLYELHTGPVAGAIGFWHGTLFSGRSTSHPPRPFLRIYDFAHDYEPAFASVRANASDQLST